MATFFETAARFAAWLEKHGSYRQLVIWRIVSAKRLETRERRMHDLIQASKQKPRL